MDETFVGSAVGSLPKTEPGVQFDGQKRVQPVLELLL